MSAEVAVSLDLATVWTLGDSGAPSHIVWQDRRLKVINKPVLWFGRRAWWEDTRRAPKGQNAVQLETINWQVEVQDVDTREIRTLDLHDGPEGWEVLGEHL